MQIQIAEEYFIGGSQPRKIISGREALSACSNNCISIAQGCLENKYSDRSYYITVLTQKNEADGMGRSAKRLAAKVVPTVVMDGFIHINSTGLQSRPGLVGVFAG